MSLACNTSPEEDLVTIVYTPGTVTPGQVIVEPSQSFRKYIQEIDSTALYSGKHLNKVKASLQCKACDYKTYHKHALDRHVQAVHDKLKFYQCSRCDYKTGHSSALKRHESKVHEKNSQITYICEVCDYQTIHKSALKRHVANRHQKDTQIVHECSLCDYRTTYEFALQRHCSTVHLKEGLHECTLCDYNTVHKHALDRHIKMVHEKPAHLSCEHCDFKSAHKSALRMHYATAHEFKDTYKCNKCGYETLYKTALNRHQATVMCGQEEKPSDTTSFVSSTQTNVVRCDDLEFTTVDHIEEQAVKHRIIYSSKETPSVIFTSSAAIPETKMDPSQVIPVSLHNLAPITMVEPVNVADGIEFHNIGELVQVVRGETTSS